MREAEAEEESMAKAAAAAEAKERTRKCGGERELGNQGSKEATKIALPQVDRESRSTFGPRSLRGARSPVLRSRTWVL